MKQISHGEAERRFLALWYNVCLGPSSKVIIRKGRFWAGWGGWGWGRARWGKSASSSFCPSPFPLPLCYFIQEFCIHTLTLGTLVPFYKNRDKQVIRKRVCGVFCCLHSSYLETILNSDTAQQQV